MKENIEEKIQASAEKWIDHSIKEGDIKEEDRDKYKFDPIKYRASKNRRNLSGSSIKKDIIILFVLIVIIFVVWRVATAIFNPPLTP